MLAIENLSKRFFAVPALKNVSLEVKNKEILGLIGPNGSGKTTLFNCVTNVFPPDSGRTFYNGEDITGKPTYELAHKGLIRTFQLVRLFRELTVLDNMIMAEQQLQEDSILKQIFAFSSMKKLERESKAKAMELLEFAEIEELADYKASDVSYGQQKLLGLAMSLMASPKLLMLDEPTAAVNPTMIEKIRNLLVNINSSQAITLFIIEHNMEVIMGICNRIIVLSAGKKIAEGKPRAIRENPDVIKAYFGE